MARLLYCYPIVLTTIGIGIHILGSLELFQLEVVRIAHVVMLVCGYWLAVLLYVEQSIGQPYWAYKAFVYDGGLYQISVVCPLVIGALAVLSLNKNLFIKVAQ